MIDFELELLLDEAIQDFESTPKKINAAAARAINRAATAGRTHVSRVVREKYNVKHGTVINAIKVDKAHSNNLTAIIKSKGSPLFLTDFKFSPSTSNQNKPVMVSVKKGARKPIAGGFVGRAPSGKAVYTRVANSRYPIRAHYGPSVPQMAGEETVAESTLNRMEEVLDDRMVREINRLLGR